MTNLFALFFIFLAPTIALCETVLVRRTVGANSVITMNDLKIVSDYVAGADLPLDEIVGRRAAVILYPNQAIREEQLIKAIKIRRNDLIIIAYVKNDVSIKAMGRALDEGTQGEKIQVMNIESREIISAVVKSTNLAEVTAE